MNTILRTLYIMVIILSLFACQNKHRFKLVNPSSSNIDFVNEIIENDSFNILTYEYVYNGGGVAIADFNNDDLPDVFFTGNMVSNRLYLNEGDLKFKDVTAISNIGVPDKWCGGVAVIDINLDGWKDIYICATAYSDTERRKNILFVNQGLDESGIPVFKDESAAYGVDDDSHSIVATFLDYDSDGDMDLYIAVNKMNNNKIQNVYRDRENPAPEQVDKLYENNWNEKKGHPVFTDVSKEAGIIFSGNSLGVNVSDINQDGFTDIYVTNDYLTRDLMYINNGDGTFTNKSDDYFQHTSYSAMGNDVVDINNDGLLDFVVLDMLPEDNYRRKTMVMNNNYTNYINNEKYNFQYQFTRNTLQINQGISPETGDPVFIDLALMAGVSSTDWSWTPLIADFDNDGLRDMIITNGFPKDVTDRDFVAYYTQFKTLTRKSMLLSKIPSVKLKNYAYRNVNGTQFEDMTQEWGIKYPSFSNGAAYGDLDNDGDLDYVINNIDDPAFLFENLSVDKEKSNWLKLKLNGPRGNPSGLGTKVRLYYGDKTIFWEHTLYRGYLSSVEDIVHFGLGKSTLVDSILVMWPGGTAQKLYDIKSNQVIDFDFNDARPLKEGFKINSPELLFEDVSEVSKEFKHEERDIIDFNIQPLLPHKLSQYGPGIAVSDVNGDGLDDVYLGRTHFYPGAFLVQHPDGTFTSTDLLDGENDESKHEDMGCLFFDADGDGDDDLYLVSGSNEAPIGDEFYRDRFFENNDGRFIRNDTAIPEMLKSGSTVRAADFDKDGDLDLFVGGRLIPFEYPKPATSYILVNDSKDGEIKFSIGKEVAPFLEDFGMVTDALWTDFDNDSWVDLVIAGEWMPLTFLRNNKGIFENVTGKSGIQNKIGWWNSLASGDFDGDGDIDYLAGNLGKNSLFNISEEYPIRVYGADFDGDKRFDVVPTVYLKNFKGEMQEVPYFGKGDMVKQLTDINVQFGKFSEFGQATIHEIFTPEQLDSAISYEANYMMTSYIENLGNGQFSIIPLPLECQVAPVYGMLAEDFNGDGYLDVLMVGNDFGIEVLQGRMDAFKGLFLKGNGKGGFNVEKFSESGFYVPGDAKALTYVLDEDGGYKVIATQNREKLKIFKMKSVDETSKVLNLEKNDCLIQFEHPDGNKIIREIYYGHSFLSQSSRRILIPSDISLVEITNFTGEKRVVTY